jgi:hypothetical protein
MTEKDYLDPKGYWISPGRIIGQMGNEGGEQEAIVKATQECSDGEQKLLCAAWLLLQGITEIGVLAGSNCIANCIDTRTTPAISIPLQPT